MQQSPRPDRSGPVSPEQLEAWELMIPGPVPVAAEVLAEMARPVVCHYGPEWTAFFLETVDAARRVLGALRLSDGPVAPPPLVHGWFG